MWLWLVLATVLGLIGGVLLERRRQLSTLGSTVAAPLVNRTSTDSSAQLSDDSRLAEAVRSLPIGLVVASETGEIVYRNAVALSFENDPLATKALVDGQINDLLARALAGRQSETELSVYGPPARRLRFVSGPLNSTEGPVGSVVVVSDISEEHRTDNVRKDFVANVSHELKTPVGAMSVLAEALSLAQDPETVARLGERIQLAALRLGETVDHLLKLSELESGTAFEMDHVDLVSLVGAAIDRCKEQAVVAGVDVLGPLEGSLDISVQGDRGQLLSALTNLINNAVKYSLEGGQVSVRLVRRTGSVDIEVADRGIGIPRSDLERIFERFYRVDVARTRAGGGTGLGLAIVRHVAINHGGEVSVESEEGRGSTFTLHLPLPDPPIPSESPADELR